ncbi:MAG: phosphate regulon transcriptional regulator PhoB [Propionivibrio sp.]|uniref:phosphate regulon transcriptional regulator PhoB n=1 Tax=Propionivibrio sp. TaxID=2212460 RepID=UPI001A4CA9B0|nr:phosphate regulon transcriptional regulator PhoB [Propionivibrio sp.]MBL8415615.1 phosphate regulon transcriptional regulator PhoB [Propionivibrio sp.]
MPARILVVEDDPAITALIATTLAHAGYSVEKSVDAESAWKRLVSSSPDAVLLDWMLPGMSGFQLLRRLRADMRMRDLPVVMLTARVDEVDKIAALEAGVDDYVTKPFSPRELVARVKAVLRRHEMQTDEDIVESGEICLSSVARKATVRGIGVELGPVEFRLLHFLMSHSERVYSRRQLIVSVWGECSSVEERTIDVHIRRLRSALEPHDCDSMVQTVRGSGYRFSKLVAGDSLQFGNLGFRSLGG